MNFKTLFVIAMLGLSFSATAQFETVSRAYEIGIENFRAPGTANDMAAFRRCNTCERISVRATPDTNYVVNGEAVTLKKFREVIAESGRRILAPVIVLHHLESDTLVSISVKF